MIYAFGFPVPTTIDGQSCPMQEGGDTSRIRMLACRGSVKLSSTAVIRERHPAYRGSGEMVETLTSG